MISGIQGSGTGYDSPANFVPKALITFGSDTSQTLASQTIGDRLLELSEDLRVETLRAHLKNFLEGVSGAAQDQVKGPNAKSVEEFLRHIESREAAIPDPKGEDLNKIFKANIIEGKPLTILAKERNLVEKALHAPIRKAIAYITNQLKLSREEFYAELRVWRAERLSQPFSQWMQTYAAWVSNGGKTPATIELDLKNPSKYFSQISFLDALNLPWRQIARQMPTAKIVATRFPEKNTDSNKQAFCLAFYSENGTLQKLFLMADHNGKLYTFSRNNPRCHYGVVGQFYLLAKGEGPICLKTALSPRAVHSPHKRNNAERQRFAFLLPGQANDVETSRIFVPAEFKKDKVIPSVCVATLEAGKPIERFFLYAEGDSGITPVASSIVAEYQLLHNNEGSIRIRRLSNLGNFASWENSPSSEIVDKARCLLWLSNESSEVPRLEYVNVYTQPIVINGRDTGRIRKSVFFAGQKVHIPVSCKTERLHLRCFEYDNKRYLGLWEDVQKIQNSLPILALIKDGESLKKAEVSLSHSEGIKVYC